MATAQSSECNEKKFRSWEKRIFIKNFSTRKLNNCIIADDDTTVYFNFNGNFSVD